ncbi:hypothetical protein [Streptomyces sp. LARHCF249]
MSPCRAAAHAAAWGPGSRPDQGDGRRRWGNERLTAEGKGAYFTVPGTPPRRVQNIQSFNTLLGGEYFFMPSLSAIRWLGSI